MLVYQTELKELKGILRGAALTAALAMLSVCLPGSLQFCLCDEDPDDCGHACHVCVEERAPAGDACGGCGHDHLSSADEDCHHPTIEAGDLTLVSSDVTIPTVAALIAFIAVDCRNASPSAVVFADSTAPPDPGGCYRSYSIRLNPLS